jgi:hypothetical protein
MTQEEIKTMNSPITMKAVVIQVWFPRLTESTGKHLGTFWNESSQALFQIHQSET